MKLLIAIPARYASTRLPGKPLLEIHGKAMLQRVYEIARMAGKKYQNLECIVATDDARIMDYCAKHNINSMLTAESCRTGTDRLQDLLSKLPVQPEFIVNLQGDNPLCPPWVVEAILDAYLENNSYEVITPCVRLNWQELAQLQASKQNSPFSGTTAIVNKEGQAIWFSKQILPAIRNVESCQQKEPSFSPVLRHIGLYGYKTSTLQKIANLPVGSYEEYEGLEQLRFLENGININVVLVDYRGRPNMSGVDSPADLAKAQKLILEYGEFN